MEFMLCAGRTDAARTSAQAAQKELANQRLTSEPLISKFKIIPTKTLAFLCVCFSACAPTRVAWNAHHLPRSCTEPELKY
jgi:hypothetical protein